MDITILGLATGIVSSIITGVVLMKITAMDKKNDRKEELRKKECVLTLKNVDAVGSLAEQTARAVKGEKLNGELDEALTYRKRMKHELEDFLIEANAERR